MTLSEEELEALAQTAESRVAETMRELFASAAEAGGGQEEASAGVSSIIAGAVGASVRALWACGGEDPDSADELVETISAAARSVVVQLAAGEREAMQ